MSTLSFHAEGYYDISVYRLLNAEGGGDDKATSPYSRTLVRIWWESRKLRGFYVDRWTNEQKTSVPGGILDLRDALTDGRPGLF